jgi:hypothetical protein
MTQKKERAPMFMLTRAEYALSSRRGAKKMAAVYWIDGQPYSLDDMATRLGRTKESAMDRANKVRAKLRKKGLPSILTWELLETKA